MARSITDICNEAIADLPAHPISSMDDKRKEARECSRFLSGCVSELIAYHDWDFVERRVSLAEVKNDREGEWLRAWALPSDLISPIALIPDYSAKSNLAIASGQVGEQVAGPVIVTPVLLYRGSQVSSEPIEYQVANGVLYTNLPTPILEYSTDALEPSKWSPLFSQAVIALLASRIYRPILGEKADTGELREKRNYAMYCRNQAVADDLNRNPRRRKEHMSEGEMARQGDYVHGIEQTGGKWFR